MGDERDQTGGQRDDEFLSVEQVAQLDAFLDALASDRIPAARKVTAQEARERALAAQLRLAREGAETPTPAFLRSLEQAVGHAVEQETRVPRRTRAGVSRGGFLRAAATLAGGAGVGIAGVEGVAVVRDLQQPRQPNELVVEGNERWYAVATVGEVAPGAVKPFSAGGVLGFLLNTEGQLHAVSAICTHMGCRLKPDASAPVSGGNPGPAQIELRCLCHGSRFDRRGRVLHGLAPSPLPSIAVRIENGHVYALGTRETV